MRVLQSIESNLLQQLIVGVASPLENRQDLIITQSIDLQIALAQDIRTPLSILQILVDRAEPQIAKIAKLHVNYAGELTTDGQSEITEIFQTVHIGQNDRLAVELLKIGGVPAEFLSEWVPANRPIEALKNPHLSTIDRVKFLARLAQEDNLEPRLEVAESIDTPAAILGQLLGDIELAVRLATQHNPNHPVDIHELIETQQSIASNWDTDPAELAILAKSHWSWIRLKVAQNPSSSAETLRELALDRVDKIQLAVANNPHTSAEVLEILLGNSESEMQAAIAAHPNTNAETLLKLFPTQSGIIFRRKYWSVEFIQKIFDRASNLSKKDPDKIDDIRDSLLRRSLTPTSILSELAKCDLAKIRATILARGYSSERYTFGQLIDEETNYLSDIARHPNVSVEILQKLFQYNNARLRMALAKNSLTPGSIRQNLLSKFTNREKLEVWIESIENPTTQSSFRTLLIDLARKENEKLGDKNQNIQLLAALANNPDFSVEERERYLQQLLQDPDGRVYLSTDPQTPVEILERLLDESTGEQIKEKLVRNPSTPDYLLQRIGDEPYDRHWHELVYHPNAPLELLKRYASQEPKNFSSCETRFERVLQNPNLPLLEGYRLRLNKYEQQNLKTTNEIFSRRPNSPYALAQVLKTDDRTAKIAAARSLNTPLDILEKLAKDSDEMVRAILLDSQHLPLSIKLSMTNDSSINIRCKLAQKHPYRDTPVEILEQLANDESEKVRAMVAANSCTPMVNLRQLANDTNFEVKKSLVSNHNAPVEVLNQLGLEEGIFDIRNPNTPGEVLDRAVRMRHEGQSSENNRRRRRSAEEINKNGLETFSKYHDNIMATSLEDLLKHPVKGSQMPSETLAQLVNSTNSSVRYRVAFHPNTPASALAKLAYDDYPPVRAGVAENRNTPPEILIVLLSREKEHYLEQNYYGTICHNIIAGRINLPSELLFELAKNESEHIRQSVVRRPELPLSLLEWFVENEKNETILISLASHNALTSNLLERLVRNSSPQVLIAIVNHPNLTSQLWTKLVENESIKVRSAIAIAYHELTPLNILDLLSTDRETEVREKLVINRNIPANILDRLAIDPELNVRMAIALNPNTSIDTLDRLAGDEKIEVRRAVSRNPQAPQSIKDKLRDLLPQSIVQSRSSTLSSLPRIYNPETDDLPTILGEYAQSDNIFVRTIALRHPLTPIEILAQRMRSIEWFDRYAVADNPATPIEIRQQLTQDSNQIVRAISIANLR